MSTPSSATWIRPAGLLAGLFLLLAASTVPAQQKVKEPTWLHGLELRVRKANEPDFTKDTKKWGVEAFKDDNTGCLLYISETGSIVALRTTAPLTPSAPGAKPKDALWLHGLKFKVRKAGMNDFTGAPEWGCEAFRDENTTCLLYATENGSINALVPAIPIN